MVLKTTASMRWWDCGELKKKTELFVFYFISTLSRDYHKWSFVHVFPVEDIFCFFNRAKRMFPRYLTTS